MAKTTKRRGKKVKVPIMDMVKQLLIWQKKRNQELRGTGDLCDLRPKDEEPCTTCRYRKHCTHYEWERRLIYKKQSGKNHASRRKERLAREQEKDLITKMNQGPEFRYYPCEPYDFCCPERGRCHEGQFCPWREE